MKRSLRQFPFLKLFTLAFFFILFLSFPRVVLAETVEKAFTFDSSAESFSGTAGSDRTLSWDSGSGSLQTVVTRKNTTASSYWQWSGTWEDLGVPSGSTVTNVRVDSGSTQCTAYSYANSSSFGPYELRDSSSSLIATLWSGRSFTSTDASPVAISSQSDQAVSAGNQASNTTVRLRLNNTNSVQNNAGYALTQRDLAVSFVITYTPPPDPPSKIVFTNAQRTLTAGDCNGDGNVLTVQLQDGSDNPAYPYSPVTVAVSSNSPNYAIYTNNTCGTTAPGGQFTFTTSDHTKSVYIKDYRRSDPTWTLEATGTGLTTGTQSITINAGAVTRLVVTLPSQSFNEGVGNTGSVDNQTAGSPFNITKLTATDNYFNINIGYTGVRTIAYSGPSSAPDSTAPSYTTSVSFTNGQSTTTLATTLYKAETTTIAATEGGSYGYASSSVTVNPGAINNYEVTVASPQTAGVCFTGTNTIKARDAWNNYRTTDTSVVNMTSTGVGVTFFSGAGCSTPTTQYTLSSGEKTIYLSTTKKQSFTVTATKDGGSETGTSSSITVNPAAASAILVKLPGQTFTDGTGITGSPSFTGTRSPNATAGTSFSIDLKAVDAYNNLVDSGGNNYNGSKTFSFADSTAGDAPNGQSPSFPASPVSFTNGEANSLSVTYYLAATGRTVEADDTGTPVSGTTSSTFTVQAGEANNYLVSPAGATQTAGSAFDVTITTRDQWNNTLGSLYSAPAGTYTWTTTAGNAPDSTPPSIGTLIQGDFTNGVATKSVTLYKAESGVTFTASEPSPSTVTGTSSTVTVNPGAINNYEVTVASPQTAGVCFTGTNTIKARDAWNNYRTTDTSIVNMTSTGVGVTFFSGAGCSTPTTQYTLSSGEKTIYLSTTKKQSFTVTATRDGSVETGTSGSITVNAAAVSRLVITLPGQTFTDGSGNSDSPSDRTAGSSFNITSISATDNYFNVNIGYSGAKTLVYTGPSNAPDTTAPSYTTSVSFTNGQSTTTLATTLYKAEGTTITVTDGGQYGYASSSVTVNPGSVSADSSDSTVTGNASSYVDTNVTITVTLKDTWRNPKSGVAAAYITLSATATNSITQPSSATDANGVTTGQIQWSDTGEKTVSVAISTISLVQNDGSTPDADGYLDDTHVITINAAPPTKIVFTNSQRTLTAGACNGAANVLTIQLQDSSSQPANPEGDTVVRVSSNSPDYTVYSDNTCSTTAPNGDFTFTTSDNTKSVYIIDRRKSSPTWTLTASEQSGPHGLTQDTQSITINAGSVTRLVATLPGQTFTDGVGNSSSPSDRTAGSSFNITSISATDNYFNVNIGYSGAKTLVYTGPSNAPDTTAPSYTTSVSFTNGQSTTTLATTLYKAEGTTITVTDGGQYGYASSSVTVNPGSVSADSSDSTVTGNTTVVLDTDTTITITLRDTWRNPKSGVAAGNITLSATATNTITQPSSDTNASGVTTGLVRWSDTGEKTVSVAISTIPLVQNDGSTPDADGYLDDTHTITAEVRAASTTIKGGTKIRGGTKL